MSTAERITDTLLSAPWNLNPVQALDFAAWLVGIDENRITGLHNLSALYLSEVLRRLDNCTNPTSLKEEWIGSRYAAHHMSVTEQGELWLR